MHRKRKDYRYRSIETQAVVSQGNPSYMVSFTFICPDTFWLKCLLSYILTFSAHCSRMELLPNRSYCKHHLWLLIKASGNIPRCWANSQVYPSGTQPFLRQVPENKWHLLHWTWPISLGFLSVHVMNSWLLSVEWFVAQENILLFCSAS